MQTDAELKAAADAKAKAQLAVIRQKVADARARAFEEAKSGTDPNPRRHASASGVEFDENATAAVTDNGKSVDFRVHMECEFGDGVLVCGSTDQLGNWNTDHALRLEWSEGDVWTANTSMSPEEIERAEAIELPRAIRSKLNAHACADKRYLWQFISGICNDT